MIRVLPFPAFLLATAPAFAAELCTFTTECYMAEGCVETEWELIVDRDAGTLSSIAENLEIVHIEPGETAQIVAKGEGSMCLLSIGPEAAAMSVQIADGPTVLTYFGECAEE